VLSSSLLTSAISRSRPTKLVNSSGKLWEVWEGSRAPRVCGKATSEPGPSSRGLALPADPAENGTPISVESATDLPTLWATPTGIIAAVCRACRDKSSFVVSPGGAN
jgi:hypothetical protein